MFFNLFWSFHLKSQWDRLKGFTDTEPAAKLRCALNRFHLQCCLIAPWAKQGYASRANMDGTTLWPVAPVAQCQHVKVCWGRKFHEARHALRDLTRWFETKSQFLSSVTLSRKIKRENISNRERWREWEIEGRIWREGEIVWRVWRVWRDRLSWTFLQAVGRCFYLIDPTLRLRIGDLGDLADRICTNLLCCCAFAGTRACWPSSFSMPLRGRALKANTGQLFLALAFPYFLYLETLKLSSFSSLSLNLSFFFLFFHLLSILSEVRWFSFLKPSCVLNVEAWWLQKYEDADHTRVPQSGQNFFTHFFTFHLFDVLFIFLHKKHQLVIFWYRKKRWKNCLRYRCSG